MLAEVKGIGCCLAELGGRVAEIGNTVTELRASQDDEGVVSVLSPTGKAYEAAAKAQLGGWLSDICRLGVVEGSRLGVAASDPASGGWEWDYRVHVRVSPDPPPTVTRDFIVYGGETYVPPPLPSTSRTLSPGKPLDADYLACVEITRRSPWPRDYVDEHRRQRDGLLKRLNLRLGYLLQRANEARPQHVASYGRITDVVALVGVVGEDDCYESVVDILSSDRCEHGHLKQMFLARRFVFFKSTFTQHVLTRSVSSPSATHPAAASPVDAVGTARGTGDSSPGNVFDRLTAPRTARGGASAPVSTT